MTFKNIKAWPNSKMNVYKDIRKFDHFLSEQGKGCEDVATRGPTSNFFPLREAFRSTNRRKETPFGAFTASWLDGEQVATRDGAGHGNLSSPSFKIGPWLKKKNNKKPRLIFFPGIVQIEAVYARLMKHKGKLWQSFNSVQQFPV